jgi:hypothetical protein
MCDLEVGLLVSTGVIGSATPSTWHETDIGVRKRCMAVGLLATTRLWPCVCDQVVNLLQLGHRDRCRETLSGPVSLRRVSVGSLIQQVGVLGCLGTATGRPASSFIDRKRWNTPASGGLLALQ